MTTPVAEVVWPMHVSNGTKRDAADCLIQGADVTETQQHQQQYCNKTWKRHKAYDSLSLNESGTSSMGTISTIMEKLDPVQDANKIAKRRNAIAKGKNTVGYDRYCQLVPKHSRRPRCLETPSTPNATVDVPNRRWLGMVRAWRVALHQYDPTDLLTNNPSTTTNTAAQLVSMEKKPKYSNAFAPSPKTPEPKVFTSFESPELDNTTPVSMSSPLRSPLLKLSPRNALDFNAESDSDDDLL